MGQTVKILVVIDEYSRRCLATEVAWSIKSHDVLDCLSDLFIRAWGEGQICG